MERCGDPGQYTLTCFISSLWYAVPVFGKGAGRSQTRRRNMKRGLDFIAVLGAIISLASTSLALQPALAETPPVISLPLGGAKFDGWSGLDTGADGAAMKVPGEAVYTVPGEGKIGTLDASKWY